MSNPVRLRFTAGAYSADVDVLVSLGGGGGSGYANARYVPRFSLPTGVTYNTATGFCEGHSVSPSYTPSGNEVLLTDQGSPAANRALLQTTITNAGSDAVRIRLAPVSTHWGDNIVLPVHNRVGVGMSIESAGVKDGSVLINNRAALGATGGKAPFRFNPASGLGSNPAGNPDLRSIFNVAAGGSNVTLLGLDLAYDSAFAATLTDVSSAGPGTQVGTVAGLVSCIGATNGRVDQVRVIHCSLQGSGNKPLLRAIRLDGTNIGVFNSMFDNIGFRGQDSQGFFCADGAGPYQLENNYFAVHHGEHFMWGGGNTSSSATVPGNIVVRRNHFEFPQRWVDLGFELKNLSEWKVGDTVLYERNRLTRARQTMYDGQGFALVIKNVAQPTGSGPGPDVWNRVRNVTVRLNEFVDCAQVLGIGGDVGVDDVTEAVDVHQNRAYFTVPGQTIPSSIVDSTVQFNLDGPTDRKRQKNLLFRYNALPFPKSNGDYRRVLGDVGDSTNPRAIGFQVQGNVFTVEEPVRGAATADLRGYFWRNGGGFNAQNAWNSLTDKVNCLWTKNAVVGGGNASAALIAGDIAYANKAAAGLGANDRTQAGSPLLTADTDGGMIGPNHALIDAGQTGVV